MRTLPMGFLLCACGAGQSPAEALAPVASEAAPDSPTLVVDRSFAELVLRQQAGKTDLRPELLAHPALQAMVRHQRMSGNPAPQPEAILARILSASEGQACAEKVLEHWKGKEEVLAAYALRAMDYLPEATAVAEVLYLELGYEIGFVAPPAIALNVGHEHFCDQPHELGYYALHEHHHLGFLQWNPWPDIAAMDEPQDLLDLVRYATWLEGSAVHAAYAIRQQENALAGDEDYRVYLDPAEAERIRQRYAELLAQARGLQALEGPAVEAILGSMSSKERLWYRYGALQAWEQERSGGRQALLAAVRELPEIPPPGTAP